MQIRSILFLTIAASCALFAEDSRDRALGDSKVFATVPFPGYPEGIAIRDGRVYVSGPAAFGVPGNAQPSKIFVYDLHTNALVDTISIQNQPDR